MTSMIEQFIDFIETFDTFVRVPLMMKKSDFVSNALVGSMLNNRRFETFA